jgi:protein-S-isoprenylcysteine O-methyltransferase Ste14
MTENQTLSIGRLVRSILSLPFMVTVVIPLALILRTRIYRFSWKLPSPNNFLASLAGMGLIGLGLILLSWTISLFADLGHGTLAPWDPAEKMVIEGPYRHARNPMISGVLLILLGEHVLLSAPAIFLWFLVFFVLNLIYMPIVEEKGLEARFGKAYQNYRHNVPAWIPRLKPWEPED